MKKKGISHLLPPRRWRKTCLILLVSALHLNAAHVCSQDARVTLQLKQVSFKEVVQNLEKATPYTFLYSDSQIESIRGLDLDYTNEDIKTILNDCLKNKGLTYSLVDNTIVIQNIQAAPQVDKLAISGTVRDDKGGVLPGVTIRIKGTDYGFTSDRDGKFRFEIPRRDDITLTFSFIGFKRKDVKVTSEKAVNVILEEEVADLDEVVVTGIFNKPKESFTGAATIVSKEQLQQNFSRNVLQTLSLIDPSFRIIENNQQGSNPNNLPEIQLRGAASLPSFENLRNNIRTDLNTPIFILDDIEITLERMMDLNQDEIENVTILKDAGATALYGARGANGVIIITTSKPKGGRLYIRYTGKARIEIPNLNSYNLMNASEKLETERLAGLYDDNQEWYDALNERVKAGVNTNWLKVPVRTGIGQTHQLYIQGGDSNYRYGVNLSYESNQGSMKGSFRDNLNGTVTLSYTTDHLTITNATNIGINTSEESPYGNYGNIATLNPYWTEKDEEGEYNQVFYHPLQHSYIPNYTYNGTLNVWDKKKYTLLSNSTRGRIVLPAGFIIEPYFSFSRSINNNDAFTPASHTNFYDQGDIEKRGVYNKGETTQNSWQIGLTLNYNKTFGKHVIFAGLNTRLHQKKIDRFGMVATGFINDKLDHISNALTYQKDMKPTGKEEKQRSAEYVGTVNYNYDMRYYADISVSFNGSSSFGKENLFAPFYSFGAGWTASRERFIADNLPFINRLRVTYNYGVSGSQNFDPYQALYVYDYDTEQNYNNQLGAYLNIFGNEQLKWQDTYQHSFNVDVLLFNERLQLKGGYYNRLTKNAISSVGMAASHGYTSYTANLGNIRNEGWELSVSVDILRALEHDFRWNINGRFARNRNTMVKLSPALKKYIAEQHETMVSKDLRYTFREGYSLDAIWVLKSPGVDPISGNRLFLDKNGNVTGHKANDALYHVGNTQPKVDGSITTMIYYKGLTLTANFQMRWGGQQLNGTLLDKIENADMTYNVDKRVLSDRWQKPGDQTFYKSIRNQNYTYANSQFVQDETTFSCTNINLMYNFPEQWVQKHLHIRSLNISAYLSDIWYSSTIKRERGLSYPYSINPNFSISCTF